MKFGIFVHPRRPKVPAEKIIHRIRSAGFPHTQKNPDVGIVVGGDGTFGYYGRTLTIPLLFVGVKQSGLVGSRARLAEIYYNDLVSALHHIENGRYAVKERKMISAALNGHHVEVLTDVYLERGRYAGCLRYETKIKPSGHGKSLPFSDYAIGNGVIISSSFGAGGYFSYPDRLLASKKLGMPRADFADDRIGICHIIPTYMVRKRNGVTHESHKIRYTVPPCSNIEIRLLRDAKARLYGTTLQSKGIPVRFGDTITVTSSKLRAKIIKLRN